MGPLRVEAGLVGSGLVVVNPPYTLERDLRIFMPPLCRLLSPQAAARTDWLAPEHGPAHLGNAKAPIISD
jgi:23S rRNA (adenine2030-N6)-methyltransferase